MSTRELDSLMVSVGDLFVRGLGVVAQAAHAEVLRQVARAGLPIDLVPYLYWVMDRGETLPSMARDERQAFDLMMKMMKSMGVVPDYSRKFEIPQEVEQDKQVSTIISNVAKWARRSMLQHVKSAYHQALDALTNRVSKIMGDQVPRGMEKVFLGRSFVQVLEVRARMIPKGSLVRQAVRALALTR